MCGDNVVTPPCFSLDRLRCRKSSSSQRAVGRVEMEVFDRSRYFNLRHVLPISGRILSKSPRGLLERLTIEHMRSLETQQGMVVNMLLSRNNCLIVEILAMLSGRVMSWLWETARYDSKGTMDRLGSSHFNLLWDKSSLARLGNNDKLKLALSKMLWDMFRDCSDLHSANSEGNSVNSQ